MFQIVDVLDELLKVSAPFFKNGKLREDHAFFCGLPEVAIELLNNDLKSDWTSYIELKRLYERTFSQYMVTPNSPWIRDNVLELLITMDQFSEDFRTMYLKPHEKPTIKETFEIFHGFYEELAKLIIIVARIIQKNKNDSRRFKSRIGEALMYLKDIDPEFLRIYNRFVHRHFRDMPAHHKIIRLDDTRFYFLRPKKISFTVNDVQDATTKLYIFLFFFLGTFLMPSFSADLMKLQEEMLSKIIIKLETCEEVEYKKRLSRYYTELGILKANNGDLEAALNLINKSLELHKKKGDNRLIALDYFNLACFHSLNRESQKSLDFLQRSIELDPKWKEKAKTDSDFDTIRELREFKDLLNT